MEQMSDIRREAYVVKYRRLSEVKPGDAFMYALCEACGEIFIDDLGPSNKYCPSGCRVSNGFPSIMSHYFTINEAQHARTQLIERGKLSTQPEQGTTDA